MNETLQHSDIQKNIIHKHKSGEATRVNSLLSRGTLGSVCETEFTATCCGRTEHPYIILNNGVFKFRFHDNCSPRSSRGAVRRGNMAAHSPQPFTDLSAI